MYFRIFYRKGVMQPYIRENKKLYYTTTMSGISVIE